MKIVPTHIFTFKETSDFLSKKVVFTYEGESVELIVIFKINEVSDNFRDDIHEIAHQKIEGLFENSKTFLSNYEMEITDKDFY